MSLSRKNWTALSSLAKQRTMEDEEEVVRERRRRNRNLSSSSEINNDLSFSTPNMVELLNDENLSSNGQRSSIRRLVENRPALERAQQVEELEPQESLGPHDNEEKFLEILRSRELRRQKRQIEILQNIKQEQQNGREKEPVDIDQTSVELPQQTKSGNKGNTESDLQTAAQHQRSIHGSKGNETSSSISTELLKQENSATIGKKESMQNNAELPQQVQLTTKHNIDRELKAAQSPHQIKPSTKCSKESVQNTAESPKQDKGYNKLKKWSEPRTAEMPRQIKLASINKKETELKTPDRTSQVSHSIVHSKGKAEALASQGKSTEQAILSPTSQKTSNEELSNAGQSSTRNQDGAKICSKSDRSHKTSSIDKPTNLSLSTGVPSSASSALTVRPESKAGTKNLSGLTSEAKSSDMTGSTSQHSPTKFKSTTETALQIGPTSPASPTRPSSHSPKHTTQVFVSLVKITRTKSTDDTETNNLTKQLKRRSAEKIMEAKAEEESKAEKTVPQIQARQSLHLQMSTSGEDTKDNERAELNTASSLDGYTNSEVTSTYSTESDSGLRRSTPRTSSFRVISQTEPLPSPFNRSASLRIPSRGFKLDAQLEKYASALQKSEIVKSPTRKTMDLFPIPEGVASKRSLFEKEAGSSGASTPTSMKSNASLSSGVSSRINKLIKNTQEEASPKSGSKDAKKIDIASKRNLWERRSLSTDKS